MRSDITCPVCRKEIIRNTYIMDGWLTEEDYVDCPERHYAYTYSYGQSFYTIGDVAYETNDVNGIKQAIKKAKEKYLYGLRHPKLFRGRGIRRLNRISLSFLNIKEVDEWQNVVI